MVLKNIFIIVFILFSSSIGQAESFEISKSEQAWLDAHPEITIGVVENLPPQSMIDNNGIPYGSDPELVKLLNKRLSGRLKIVTGSWQELYNDAKEKQLDALMSLTPSQERSAYFNYTRPYMSFPHVIVAKDKGKHFGNISSLVGHIVALESGVFLISYLQEHYPNIEIKEYKDAITALKAVQHKDAHAYIGGIHVVEYLLSTNGMEDLDFHGHSNETSETNVIAVRKDWPVLSSILDRILASIPHNELHAVTDHLGKVNATKIASQNIELTDEEMIWIQGHPNIMVGAETDWPPYDYVVNGKAVGFANDHMRLLAEKAGLNIQFVHGFSWSELTKKIQQKKIDILPCLSKNIKREKFINFTSPYLGRSFSLVANRNAKGIKSFEDLNGKSLAQVKGYSTNKSVVEKFPKINIVLVDSPVEALMAVNEGLADGYMDRLGVINYLRREHLIDNLRVVSTDAFPIDIPLHIGVRKDWPILNKILEKAMASVTQEENNALKRLWLGTAQMDSKEFYLTSAEKEWLSSLGTLRVGVSGSWAPIKFVGDDGTHQGLSSEYTKIIQNKLGLDFEIVVGPWQQILDKTRAGEIDILPILNETKKRRKFLTFTEPFVRIPMIIGTKTNAPYYAHIHDLTDILVGVGQGFAIQGKLGSDYPDITTKGYRSIEDAMLALDTGKILAMVANSAVFTYFQNKLGLKSSISINNTSPYEDILAIGVRHELAPLVPLLNRILAGISYQEHELIMDKWTNLPVQKITDWKMVWQVSGISVGVLLLVLFWSLKMAKEIKRRKTAERRLIEDAIEIKRVMEERDRHLNLSQDLICIAGMDGYFKYVSPSWEKTLGYTTQELMTRPFLDFIHPDDHVKNNNEVASLAAGNNTLDFENRFINKNGSIHIISWIATPSVSEGVIYCTGRDVTQRKKNQAKLKKYADTQAILLREVNHRVKNNLTAIISMLHMEADKAETLYCSGFCSQPLKITELRISILLVVHSMLSISKWKPIRLTDICQKVIQQSMNGFLEDNKFHIHIKDSDVFIESDMAHSLALVLSELAVNSAKYAFNHEDKIDITISAVQTNDFIELKFLDNGPGFSAQVLAGETMEGHIGMGILNGIVTGNMGGHIKLANNGGACIQITFPTGKNSTQITEEA